MASGAFARLTAADPDHGRTVRALVDERGPYVVRAGIPAEVAYLVERRLGSEVLDGFLAFPSPGGCSSTAVTARSGGRVRTLDRRDFDVVAGGVRVILLPAYPEHRSRPPPADVRG